MEGQFFNWMQANPTVFFGTLLLVMLALYFSKNGFYAAFRKIALLLSASLRLQSRALITMTEQMKQRNREVLLEMGQAQKERDIEREFYRVNAIVDRDLSGYPELQKVISEHITAIEEDYQKTGESPPPSPDWVEAVEAVANLKEAHKGNPVIAKILSDLHESVIGQHKQALGDYREGIAQRHRLLHSMMPHWRKLNNAVGSVGNSIKGLLKHSAKLDVHMDQYEQIRQGSEQAERALRSSASIDFLFSVLIILLATWGAFFNFQLIALPMSEMVGGTSSKFNLFGQVVSVAQVAGAFIVILEVILGVFLMECLHITRMFPALSSLDDRIRKRMIWALFIFMFFLASIESGLAFMRDQIAAADEALKFSLGLGGEAPVASDISQTIPLAAAMMLGFMLPFALMFVAIPIETLFLTGRVVLSSILVQVLHLAAILLRLLANAIKNLVEFIIAVYDIFIFIPLWIEGAVKSFREDSARRSETSSVSESSTELRP